jgi:hypothetical protein
MIPMPPPNHEETTEAIAACGIPIANIRIDYDDELQSDVVTITDPGGVDEEKFHCLRKAIHPFYFVEIEAADQRAAFQSFSNAEDRQQAKVVAVEWLTARGLLDPVPRYDPAHGIQHFARALEAACSLPPESTLTAFDESILTFRADYLERGATMSTGDEFTCISHMLAASNADEHGVLLGFIGNAAAGDKP